jgi:hypothetical protein
MMFFRPIISKILPSAAIVTAAIFLMCGLHSTAFSMSPEFQMVGDDMHVGDAPDTDVIAFGKKVVVNKRAKGVFVIGGDVVVDGDVTGDVGVIGGSITQKKDAYIGGDVIVVGGKYQPEIDHPRRGEGKQTVMLGIFEDEIREFTRNPASILTPTLSVSFFAQRLLSLLFWFLVSMGLTTIAPGAVTRSITRLKLSSLKVAAIGTAALIAVLFGVAAGIGFLPNYLSGIVGLMALFIIALAYVLGRTVLHLIFGRYIQKQLFGQGVHSEALAVFTGVAVWTILLSLPYVWTVGVLSLFAIGTGLVLTAGPRHAVRP